VPQLSKVLSLKNKYGDVATAEVNFGINGNSFYVVGNNIEKYNYDIVGWIIEGNAYITHINTNIKTADGYKVKQLCGPFNAVADLSSSRVLCWEGRNVKIYDFNTNNFIAEFNFKYSPIIAWYLCKEIRGLKQKNMSKIQSKIDMNKYKFIDWIFNHNW